MFGRKNKYKSFMPDQPNSKAPVRPNSIQPKKRGSNMLKNRTAPVPARGKHSLSLKPEKVVKGPNKCFETGGLVPDNVNKQSHIRIEFDDIADTPKVFIDGVDVTDWKRNGKALVALYLDWITDDEQPQSKSFKLKTIEKHGNHIVNCKYNITGR